MPEMCCHICRDLCGDEDPQRRDWTQDLEGRCAHVGCLEGAGLWNAQPRERNDD